MVLKAPHHGLKLLICHNLSNWNIKHIGIYESGQCGLQSYVMWHKQESSWDWRFQRIQSISMSKWLLKVHNLSHCNIKHISVSPECWGLWLYSYHIDFAVILTHRIHGGTEVAFWFCTPRAMGSNPNDFRKYSILFSEPFYVKYAGINLGLMILEDSKHLHIKLTAKRLQPQSL